LSPHIFDRIKKYYGRDRESLEFKEKRKKEYENEKKKETQ
jgi:hypothetical protein